jgi:hypothetical protein
MVVGAPFDDGAGDNRGAVYVYMKHGPTWTEHQILAEPTPADNNLFGWRVAIHGDVIVASARDSNNSFTGYIHVFERTGNTWNHVVKIDPSTQQTQGRFGDAIDVYCNTIISTAWGEDLGGTSRGAAYVYVKNGGVWGEQQKLIPSVSEDSAYFGQGLSLHENRVVIGAPSENLGGTNRGAVYIFERDGVTWTQNYKISPSDSSDNQIFGAPLSLFEDIFVVGVTSDSTIETNGGSVYTFHFRQGSWVERTKLFSNTSVENGLYGNCVSVHNNRLIVGAPGENDDKGKVFFFVTPDNDGLWENLSTLSASDGAADDQFGYACATYCDDIIIGARNEDPGSVTEAGAVYTYTERRIQDCYIKIERKSC